MINNARRISIKSAGGYDKLVEESFSIGECSENELIIEIKASGVNYADVCIRWGLYESAKEFVGWPITPGFEYAGIVVSVGANVNRYKVGDEVFGVSLFNAYASHVKVPEHQVFPMFQNLTFEQAAGVPAVYLTAYHALFQNVVTRPGMKVLIHSAAGGVGSALVQMATLKGMEVVGVVGREEKVEYTRELGAKKVICKAIEDWSLEARKFSPEGYDIVLDANGYSTLSLSYELLAPMGKLISYGFHSMLPKKGGRLNWPKLIYTFLKTPRFNPVNMTNKNKSLITFNLSFLFDRKDILDEAMSDIKDWLEQGEIKPPRIESYSLSNVSKAHERIESGKTMGKLVLTP